MTLRISSSWRNASRIWKIRRPSLHEQKRDANKESDRLSITLRKATDSLRSLQERYNIAQLEILTLRQGNGLLQDTETSIAVDPPLFPRQTFASYTPHHPSIDPALLSSHHTFTNYDSRLFALDSMGQTRLLWYVRCHLN
jgi:hypothetical protein